MSKIVVLGDSIAYGKWDEQGGWVQRLRSYIDKAFNIEQNKNLQVYNLGIPGEVTTRLVERAQKELSDRVKLADTGKNNLVIVAVGINDTNNDNWMTGKKTSPEDFKNNIKDIVSTINLLEGKPIILGLTPINEEKYSERFPNRLENKTIKEYDQYLSEFSKSMGIFYIALFDVLITKTYTSTLIDGIHPNSNGHEMIFQAVKEFLEKEKLLEFLLT